MATPPVKTFGTESRRRGSDSERAFSWYTPAGRRATIYEDVTIDTQPSIHRHVDRDWPVFFEDGRGTWNERSTALRHTDWYAFRDPEALWERPFYQQGSAREAEIESAIAHARSSRLLADVDPAWLDFLRTWMQVPAFLDHGTWLALATCARDALCDTLATCIAFSAAMKQRQAQALLLYAMDLEPELGELPLDPAKELFLTDPAWQPARACVERLSASTDWCEISIAVALCVEPLLGRLVRRELLVRSAAACGDTITPTVLRGAEREVEWICRWGGELARFAIADETHGECNRATIAGWVADWSAEARAAARALEPLFDARPRGVPFADALASVERDYGGVPA